MSFQTIRKFIKKLSLPCSICGWNEATCDLHHIIPRKNNGSDDVNNLIIVCPNCHRKIHNKKIDKTINELQDLSIGSQYQEYKLD